MTAKPKPLKAETQLERVLQLVPLMADGERYRLSDLAQRSGVEAGTIRTLLTSLIRYDAREHVEVYFEGEWVRIYKSHFHRPMRLTRGEMRALELGLSVLRLERPPDEHRAIDGALKRLREVLARGADDGAESVVYGDSGAGPEGANHLQVLRRAIRARRRVMLAYRKASQGAAERREVSPYMVVRSRGRFFVVGWCEKAQALRVFRLDRVEGVELLSTPRREGEVSLEGLKDRAFFGDGSEQQLKVRYSARIARWIEEREMVEKQADGSVVGTYPLGDVEWAVRHVLQYGKEAEVVGPDWLAKTIASRLSLLEGEEAILRAANDAALSTPGSSPGRAREKRI
jgi:proteasome accessory factor C